MSKQCPCNSRLIPLKRLEEDSSFAGTAVGGFLCDEDDLDSFHVNDESLVLNVFRAGHDEQNVQAGGPMGGFQFCFPLAQPFFFWVWIPSSLVISPSYLIIY